MGYPVFSDEYFMNEALKEARKAAELGEVPVGAVIVCNNMVIARGHNLTEQLNDVTAHAEIQVITSAAESLGGKYLTGCTLYVTLEPCLMCGGALYWSQISGIVYGAPDTKRGFGRLKEDVIHPKCTVKGGVLESECSAVVKEFFAEKRK